MKKILTKKGFTLIELIVVIAILAILAAILIPSLTNYLTAANNSRKQSDSRSEYSRVVLSYATTDGEPVGPDNAAITSDEEYDLGEDLSCKVTFDTTSITAFECTDTTLTWSLVNNFQPVSE